MADSNPNDGQNPPAAEEIWAKWGDLVLGGSATVPQAAVMARMEMLGGEVQDLKRSNERMLAALSKPAATDIAAKWLSVVQEGSATSAQVVIMARMDLLAIEMQDLKRSNERMLAALSNVEKPQKATAASDITSPNVTGEEISVVGESNSHRIQETTNTAASITMNYGTNTGAILRLLTHGRAFGPLLQYHNTFVDGTGQKLGLVDGSKRPKPPVNEVEYMKAFAKEVGRILKTQARGPGQLPLRNSFCVLLHQLTPAQLKDLFHVVWAARSTNRASTVEAEKEN
ncbi:hypothetical protein G7046_g2370 [Stylonectria norvegica]|nr:hypothetical protein G7046_g2370 [Stylonectria norvegica]